MAALTISPIAQSGFVNAASYDAHRPSYPVAAVSSLLKNLNIEIKQHAKVVDLAAGTGKFTELLASREEEYEIIAVEPHKDMLEVLKEKDGLKGVRTVEGSAENMAAVSTGWADAVVVAQAFHWFANKEALQEIHRVLKPAGVLGLIWNIEDYNSPTDWEPATRWLTAVKDIMWSFADKAARFRHGEWQKVFDDQVKTTPLSIVAADPLFSLPLGEDKVKWTQWLSKDAIWERFHTISHIAVLQGEKLEQTKRSVYEAMSGSDVETNEKGELKIHGQTVIYWTTAIPNSPLQNDS